MAEQLQETQPRQGQGFRDFVVVEVAEERGRNLLWNPRGVLLRSRWSLNVLLPNEQVELLADLPDIPGQMVKVDGINRELRIFDPLGLPENRDFTTRLKNTMKARFNQDVRPELDITVENASQTEIKTWLFWLRRIVTGRPLDAAEKDAMEHQYENPDKARFARWPKIASVNGRVPMARVVEGNLPEMKQILALPGKTGVSQHDNNFRKVRWLEDTDVYKEGLAGVA